MLGKIRLLTGKLGFVTNNEEVSRIDINYSQATNEEINKALVLVKYFNGLQKFFCYDNPNLESLPKLPDSLKVLYCHNNPNPQFKSLPELSDSLQVLKCYNTKLESLPKLPDSLKWLCCYNNPKLESLPKLPDSLKWLDLENTPAAKNPEVIERLKNFKAKHPLVKIYGVDLS
jgi:hypothetical protein